MKRKLNITAMLMMLAVAGCQKDVQQQPIETTSEVSTANARITGNNTVYLSVTVQDATGEKILSDGLGAYKNGIDRVDAQLLSSDGNFYMNTNNNTIKLPLRTMQILPGTDVNLNGVRNYNLRTAPLVDGSTKPIYNLTVGESQYMSFRVWGLQQSGILEWKLLFRNGDTREDPLTDYVKVTRQANDANGNSVWTIEPANLSTETTNAKLEDANNIPKGSGYYQVPFKLILTKTGK